MLIDSDLEPGLRVAAGLVNELVVAPSGSLTAALAVLSFDETSVADFHPRDGEAFAVLARELHGVFQALDAADDDRAAEALNKLLRTAPPHPHLVKEDGTWVMHHHLLDAALVPAWTSICAEALARLVGDGRARRARLCEATDCGRAFVDATKNGSRRFCSTTCQNRVKATARRRRQAAQRHAVRRP